MKGSRTSTLRGRHVAKRGGTAITAAAAGLLGVVVGAGIGWTTLPTQASSASTSPFPSVSPAPSTTTAKPKASTARKVVTQSGSHSSGAAPGLSQGAKPQVHGNALAIPSLGVDAPIDTVAFQGSVLTPPNDTQHVGVWNGGASLTAVMGTTVIVGHVSDDYDRPGALFHLSNVHVGTEISVRSLESGTTVTERFVVTGKADFSKTALPAWIFQQGEDHLLRIVTCDAKQVYVGGGFHYADNLVVTATPVD